MSNLKNLNIIHKTRNASDLVEIHKEPKLVNTKFTINKNNKKNNHYDSQNIKRSIKKPLKIKFNNISNSNDIEANNNTNLSKEIKSENSENFIFSNNPKKLKIYAKKDIVKTNSEEKSKIINNNFTINKFNKNYKKYSNNSPFVLRKLKLENEYNKIQYQNNLTQTNNSITITKDTSNTNYFSNEEKTLFLNDIIIGNKFFSQENKVNKSLDFNRFKLKKEPLLFSKKKKNLMLDRDDNNIVKYKSAHKNVHKFKQNFILKKDFDLKISNVTKNSNSILLKYNNEIKNNFVNLSNVVEMFKSSNEPDERVIANDIKENKNINRNL